MNKVALIDLQYIPSIEYFICLSLYDEIIFDIHEHYEKQTYRNRCHILSANKIDRLSVPVLGGTKKQPMKDLQIDYKQKWVNNHWRAITSAYGKAPFFEFYADYFKKIYDKKLTHLIDLNLEFLTLCLNFLQLKVSWKLSEAYTLESPEGVDDLRSYIHPKSGFENRRFYHPYPYQQLFGKDFVYNLSIVDLLFCEGPNARKVLQLSSVENE